jgi:hypothetical protein
MTDRRCRGISDCGGEGGGVERPRAEAHSEGVRFAAKLDLG